MSIPPDIKRTLVEALGSVSELVDATESTSLGAAQRSAAKGAIQRASEWVLLQRTELAIAGVSDDRA